MGSSEQEIKNELALIFNQYSRYRGYPVITLYDRKRIHQRHHHHYYYYRDPYSAKQCIRGCPYHEEKVKEQPYRPKSRFFAFLLFQNHVDADIAHNRSNFSILQTLKDNKANPVICSLEVDNAHSARSCSEQCLVQAHQPNFIHPSHMT